MKRIIIVAVLLLAGMYAVAQSGSNPISGQVFSPNVITTGVPFVSIAPDARGGSMGDCGVATDADVYSMHYNPAKYVYLPDKLSVGLGYSPWLQQLASDMHLAYLAFATKIDSRSAVGATLRYFDCGDINFRDENNYDLGTYNPNEWALDATYSRMLGDYLSGAVSGRFIYSNLTQGQADNSMAGWSVAADIGLYYKRPTEWFSDMDSEFSWGASITNIGSKISYSSSSEEKDFIPTTLRAGAQLKLELDDYNTLAFTTDLSKLMVPTPPMRDANSITGDIIYGHDDNVSVVMGMIQSFYDAPGYHFDDNTGQWVSHGVFYEELCEINAALGIEYWYNNVFAVRAGYFNETAMKGSRKFVTLGAALRYNVFGLDVSYLIPVAARAGISPLENTLRFNLTYNMGARSNN